MLIYANAADGIYLLCQKLYFTSFASYVQFSIMSVIVVVYNIELLISIACVHFEHMSNFFGQSVIASLNISEFLNILTLIIAAIQTFYLLVKRDLVLDLP